MSKAVGFASCARTGLALERHQPRTAARHSALRVDTSAPSSNRRTMRRDDIDIAGPDRVERCRADGPRTAGSHLIEVWTPRIGKLFDAFLRSISRRTFSLVSTVVSSEGRTGTSSCRRARPRGRRVGLVGYVSRGPRFAVVVLRHVDDSGTGRPSRFSVLNVRTPIPGMPNVRSRRSGGCFERANSNATLSRFCPGPTCSRTCPVSLPWRIPVPVTNLETPGIASPAPQATSGDRLPAPAPLPPAAAIVPG